MKAEEIAKWLKENQFIVREIHALEAELNEIQTSNKYSLFYIRLLKNRLYTSKKTKEKIYTAINKIDDVELRTILTEKYIRGKTWNEIAGTIYYSVTTTQRRKKKALAALCKTLEEI